MIIQQPNGRYCIYSTVVDNVTYYDLDRDGIVEAFMERERQSVECLVDRTLKKLRNGDKPYLDYPEILARISELHGEDEAAKLTELLAKAQSDREAAAAPEP